MSDPVRDETDEPPRDVPAGTLGDRAALDVPLGAVRGRAPSRAGRLWMAVGVTIVLGVGVLAFAGSLIDPSHTPTSVPFPDASLDARATLPPAASDQPAASAPASSAAAPSATVTGPLPAAVAVVGPGGPISIVSRTGHVRLLSDQGGVSFGFPAWSPDGSRIAAIRDDGSWTTIAVFDASMASGQSPSPPSIAFRSSINAPFYLYWAPDGRRVSFLTNEPDGLALRVASASAPGTSDVAPESALIRRGAPLYFDWITDERLLLHVGSGVDAFVGEVGGDGDVIGQSLPSPGDFRSAVASADGRLEAYARQRGAGAGEIVATAQDGSNEHGMPVFGTAAMLFDPGGGRLASIGPDRPGQTNLDFPIGPLRVLETSTGAASTLLPGLVVAFFWSPDGRTIAALRLQDAGGPTALGPFTLAAAASNSPSSGVPANPEVHLVFVDVATGRIRSDRTVSLGTRFANELLPYFDQYALSHRLWAPDSSSILLPVTIGDDSTKVVALPPDGGDPTLVVDGDAGFWSP